MLGVKMSADSVGRCNVSNMIFILPKQQGAAATDVMHFTQGWYQHCQHTPEKVALLFCAAVCCAVLFGAVGCTCVLLYHCVASYPSVSLQQTMTSAMTLRKHSLARVMFHDMEVAPCRCARGI